MTVTLDTFPLPKKLYQMYLSKKSGRLEISTKQKDTFELWVKNGNPVSVNMGDQGIDPAELMVSLRILTREAIEEAKTEASSGLGSFYAVLLQKKMLPEKELESVFRKVLVRDVAVLMTIDGPIIHHEEEVSTPNEDQLVGLFQILYFCFLNHSTPDQLVAIEDRFKGQWMMPNTNLRYILPSLDLKPSIMTALEKWETARSTTDLMATMGLNQRELLALVSLLQFINCLKVTPKAELSSKKVASDLPDPVKATVATTAPTPSKNAEDNQLSPELQAFKADIETWQKKLDSYNPLKILGITIDAKTPEIKKRYMSLVARFHPDRLSGTPLESMKDTVNEIFSAIGNANRMLTDKKEREVFIKIYNDPILKGNIKYADAKDRARFDKEKVKVFYRKKDWANVVRVGRRCLGIFPKDPDVLAMLARGMMDVEAGGGSSNGPSVVEMLERSLKLDPDNEFANIHMAEWLMNEGQVREALEHVEKVLASNSYNRDALNLRNELKSILG